MRIVLKQATFSNNLTVITKFNIEKTVRHVSMPLLARKLRLCSHLFSGFETGIMWLDNVEDKNPPSLLMVDTQFCGFLHANQMTQRHSQASQLFALQHGLGGGAGEEDGAGLRGGEHGLDVKPLASQSCVAAACPWSLPHGSRDALMPLS